MDNAARSPQRQTHQQPQPICRALRTQQSKAPLAKVHADALCLRRPLLTTLRLGLIPGDVSRGQIDTFVSGSGKEVEYQLRQAYAADRVASLIDRLDYLYPSLAGCNHLDLWSGIAAFLRKPDDSWLSSFNRMIDIAHNFENIAENAVAQNQSLRGPIAELFKHLSEQNELVLTPRWLWRHSFVYGLFGSERRGGDTWFLSEDEVRRIAHERSVTWREQQLKGQLIPSLWSPHALFLLLGTQEWDEACRETLNNALEVDVALDGFTLLLFGGHYLVGRSTVEQLCSAGYFYDRVRRRLAHDRDEDMTGSLRTALEKAIQHEHTQ